MNLPTQLTIARILLTFIVMALVFAPGTPAKVLALVLFSAAAATDWLDGYLARKHGQTSALGALLDPIADKVLVLGMFLAFVQLELVRAWMVLVILIRELLITSVRLYSTRQHIVIPAAKEGKQKAVSQMATVILVLLLLAIRELVPAKAVAGFEPAMMRIILAAMWVTVILTVISGASFFWRNRSVLFYAGTR
jgi:CDP-diacylglycerol--glycerol-3-phosphate 3-phosphatidyltransferase